MQRKQDYVMKVGQPQLEKVGLSYYVGLGSPNSIQYLSYFQYDSRRGYKEELRKKGNRINLGGLVVLAT